MSPCKTLCFLIGRYRFYIGPYAFLWVFMFFFRSLCAFMGSYNLFVRPYWSLLVLTGPHGSIWNLVVPYGIL